MLSELTQLLAACPDVNDMSGYRAAIIDENVLGKRTVTTRKESFRRLRELYALSQETLLFRAMLQLWDADPHTRPILALLCAVARDPLLRATADLILETPTGDQVTPHMIAESAARSFPDRYNPTMLANIGRHAASSWQQSGHVSGRLVKHRARAEATPIGVTYALLLAYLCGDRGDLLLESLWVRLLDAPLHQVRELAAAAARQGYLDYRHGGGVTEIGFSYLLGDQADQA
jgi:hypothetical protein